MKIPKKVCATCGGSGKQIDSQAAATALRAARVKAGRSLRVVAAAMGISPMYLSDLERGNRAWSGDLVDRFMVAIKP